MEGTLTLKKEVEKMALEWLVLGQEGGGLREEKRKNWIKRIMTQGKGKEESMKGIGLKVYALLNEASKDFSADYLLRDVSLEVSVVDHRNFGLF